MPLHPQTIPQPLSCAWRSGVIPTSDTLSEFPIYALPGLLGEIAHDLAAGGIDKGIVGAVAIGFASMLAQGTADAAWPNGQTLPVGPHFAVVSISGSGKSATCKTLKDPIDEFLAQYHTDTEQHSSPEFFIEDATRPAIIEQLNVWPVGILFTDEGGIVNRLLRQDAPTMAKLTDSANLLHARVSTGRMALVNYRFLLIVFYQPDIFEEIKHMLGASRGGVGIGNRLLFVKALEPKIGAEIHPQRLSDSVAKRYAARVREMLTLTITNVHDKKQRPILRLSPEALQYFVDLKNQMRQLQSADPSYQRIAEYINRHSERVLRLAGAIHVFEYGTDAEISLATIQAADQIGRWSIDAFLALTYVPPKQTQAELDGEKLLQALQEVVRTTNQTTFLMKNCRRLAPNLGLTASQFTRALPFLANNGKIQIVLDRRSNESIWVNPDFPRLFRY
jgi:hypothetical protein